MTNYYLWRTKNQELYIPVKGEGRLIEDKGLRKFINVKVDIDPNFEIIIPKETYDILKKRTSEEFEEFSKRYGQAAASINLTQQSHLIFNS